MHWKTIPLHAGDLIVLQDTVMLVVSCMIIDGAPKLVADRYHEVDRPHAGAVRLRLAASHCTVDLTSMSGGLYHMSRWYNLEPGYIMALT